jgi:hypothetical protein
MRVSKEKINSGEPRMYLYTLIVPRLYLYTPDSLSKIRDLKNKQNMIAYV